MMGSFGDAFVSTLYTNYKIATVTPLMYTLFFYVTNVFALLLM